MKLQLASNLKQVLIGKIVFAKISLRRTNAQQKLKLISVAATQKLSFLSSATRQNKT
jgi:hypothetical protein